MSAITFERLIKLYPRGQGIGDIDLEVERAAALGFIAPNGAGKSTTIERKELHA